MLLKDNISKIDEKLSKISNLHHLFSLSLDYILQFRSEVSIIMKGSIAKGNPDCYSDLDYLIVYENRDVVLSIISGLKTILTKEYRILSLFEANHVNDDLFVFYLIKEDNISKIDIQFVEYNAFCVAPTDIMIILNDPKGVLTKNDATKQKNEIDFNVIYEKFSVWLWFIFYLIKRGEYMHAARSIDFSRENALLPVLRSLYDLPVLDGHRRIEMLLPEHIITELYNTYPNSLSYDSLIHSLLELSNIFKKYWTIMTGGKEETKLFDEIIHIILLKK